MDNGAQNYLRYKNGDDLGFYEIVREYYDGLVMYINGIVGDYCRAEELADDTLLKLAVKRPNFNGKSSFKTWLYSIGRNAALDGMRKKAHADTVSLEEAAAEAQSAENDYLKTERNVQLYKALEQLKPDYREVLYLSYFEDMKTEQICDVMKKSKSNVYTLISRAQNALKENLLKEGFVYENV